MTRVESSVTALSWIPRDAMEGMGKLAADLGVSHWDLPPPDRLDNLDDLIAADAIRLANELRAWIDVEGGQIRRYGQLGQGHIGRTTLRAGPRQVLFPAVAFPDLRPAPEVGPTWVRFVQTAGGRTGAPMPRRVRRAPFVQLAAPTAWSTLALTIYADGSSQYEVVGASPFPRHWIYNDQGQLVAKTGLIDFNRWRRGAFGRHTPWGDEESPAQVTAVETALERRLSRLVIDASPTFRKLKPGAILTEQGATGTELFLLFEGVVAVEVDGHAVTEVGPGAILGEMAVLTHDVMAIAVIPARVHDRSALVATLAAILGVNPVRIADKLDRPIPPTVARVVAELPVERFHQVEPRLRAVEGLTFTRRQGRETPTGKRTATLRAVTACRVAVVPETLLDREALAELAAGRQTKDP
jgi:CRP-like cAMP-binding protein